MDKGERGQFKYVTSENKLLSSKEKFDFLRAKTMARQLSTTLSFCKAPSLSPPRRTLARSFTESGRANPHQRNFSLELMQNSVLATMACVMVAPLEPAINGIQKMTRRGMGKSVQVNMKKVARSGVLTPAARMLSYHSVCNFTWFGGYGLAKEKGCNEAAAAAVGACASILATIPFSTTQMWKSQHIMASLYTGVPYQSIRWTIYKNLQHKSLSAVVPRPLRPMCKDRQISIFEAGAAAGAGAYIATLPLALYLSPRILGSSVSNHVIRHTTVSALSFACFCSTYTNSKERLSKYQDPGHLMPSPLPTPCPPNENDGTSAAIQDECSLSSAKKSKPALSMNHQSRGLKSSGYLKRLKTNSSKCYSNSGERKRRALSGSLATPLLMPPPPLPPSPPPRSRLRPQLDM